MNFQKKFKLENIPLTHEEMAILFNFLNNMAKEQLISSFSLELKEKNNTNYLIIRIYQGDRPFSSKKFYFETSTRLDCGVFKFYDFPYFEFDEETELLTVSCIEKSKDYPTVNKLVYDDSSISLDDDRKVLFSLKFSVRVHFPELEDFMDIMNHIMKNHKVYCKIRYLKHHSKKNYKNHFKISFCLDEGTEPIISFTIGVKKNTFNTEDNYLLTIFNFLSLGNYELDTSFFYLKLFNDQVFVIEVYEPDDVEKTLKIKKQLSFLES